MSLDVYSRRKYKRGKFVYLLDDDEKTAWIEKGHIGRCRKYRLPDHVMIDGERYTIESVEAGAYNKSRTLRNHYCKIIHATPSFNAHNIKKVGFIPKSGNDNFNNQERVYLFKGDTTKMVAKNYAQQLYEECDEKDKSPIYTLFTINVEMIPSNVQFFFDAKVEFGMFIDEPIPPNAIIGYEEFNVNDIEE